MPLWALACAGGVMLLLLGFGGGYFTAVQFHQAGQLRQAEANTTRVLAQAATSNQVVAQHADKEAAERLVYRTIIKEVVKYVTEKDDAACTVNPDFTELWNRASQPPLSPATGAADAGAAAAHPAGR